MERVIRKNQQKTEKILVHGTMTLLCVGEKDPQKSNLIGNVKSCSFYFCALMDHSIFFVHHFPEWIYYYFKIWIVGIWLIPKSTDLPSTISSPSAQLRWDTGRLGCRWWALAPSVPFQQQWRHCSWAHRALVLCQTDWEKMVRTMVKMQKIVELPPWNPHSTLEWSRAEIEAEIGAGGCCSVSSGGFSECFSLDFLRKWRNIWKHWITVRMSRKRNTKTAKGREMHREEGDDDEEEPSAVEVEEPFPLQIYWSLLFESLIPKPILSWQAI